jgi:hypothetical protein
MNFAVTHFLGEAIISKEVLVAALEGGEQVMAYPLYHHSWRIRNFEMIQHCGIK